MKRTLGASRARTTMVQTARNCGLTRYEAPTASDFHKLFHRNCEDRRAPDGDVT